MSRWSWHEKPGRRKGIATRKSSYLTPQEEEAIDRERHLAELQSVNDNAAPTQHIHIHLWHAYCTYNGDGTNGTIRRCDCGARKRMGSKDGRLINEYAAPGEDYKPIDQPTYSDVQESLDAEQESRE